MWKKYSETQVDLHKPRYPLCYYCLVSWLVFVNVTLPKNWINKIIFKIQLIIQ